MGKKSLSNPYRTIATLREELRLCRQALAAERDLHPAGAYERWNKAALAASAMRQMHLDEVVSASSLTDKDAIAERIKRCTCDARTSWWERMDGLDWVQVISSTMVLVGVAIMVISHVVA